MFAESAYMSLCQPSVSVVDEPLIVDEVETVGDNDVEMNHNKEEEENQLPPLKQQRRTSEVWNHFHTQNSQVICDDCGKHFQCHTSTSSLRYHLKNVHQREVSVSVAATRARSCNGPQADELLSRFMAEACLPPSLVEDTNFRKLLHYLEPNWKPPDQHKLTSTLFPQLRRKVETQMRQHMTWIRHYSLSLHSWTDPNGTSYLAITCHGISTHWNLHSFLLDVRPLYEHTFVSMAEWVRDVLNRWNISLDRIVSGITHAVATMKRVVREDLGLFWLPCAMYTLDESVQNSLGQVKSMQKKIPAICAYFDHCPQAENALREQQMHLDLPTKKLTLASSSSSWGLTYKLMSRMLKIKPALCATLADAPSSAPPDLTGTEWQQLDQLKRVLTPIKQATSFLSEHSSVTVALVLPLFHQLIKHHLLLSDTDCETIKHVKQSIARDIQTRWTLLYEGLPEVIVLSVYLDPRLKDFSFVDDSTMRQLLLEQAHQLVECLFQSPDEMSLNREGCLVDSSRSESSNSSSSSSSRHKLQGLFGNMVNNSSGSRLEELEAYHHKPACSFTVGDHVVDPLQWWQKHEIKYPFLAAQARRFLCITATSISCEPKRLGNSNSALSLFLSCNASHT